jgi:hypothetical protein
MWGASKGETQERIALLKQRQEELKQEYLTIGGDDTRAAELEFMLVAVGIEISNLETALSSTRN